MDYEFRDDRLHIMRTAEDKQPLLRQLNRLAGQVGGLRKMIEHDRYSGDEMQQASAIISAVREVVLMLIEQHLAISASVAAASQQKPVMDEMRALLQLALGNVSLGSLEDSCQ